MLSFDQCHIMFHRNKLLFYYGYILEEIFLLEIFALLGSFTASGIDFIPIIFIFRINAKIVHLKHE